MRVWVGWNPVIWEVFLHFMSGQIVTCNATFLEKNISFLVSFVYAFNDAIDRVPLWDYLLSLSNTSMPWCLLCDFNCVVNLAKNSGGRKHWTPEMQAFEDYLSNFGIGQVRTVGEVSHGQISVPNVKF